MTCDKSDFQYVIAGKGKLETDLRQLAEMGGVSDRVHFLGFRTDMADLYKAADIFVFPSKREGLSVSLTEAMAAGLPVVCSRIRGNTDLVKDGKNGFLFNPEDAEELAEKIKLVTRGDKSLMGDMGKKKIQACSAKKVMRRMKKIYG